MNTVHLLSSLDTAGFSLLRLLVTVLWQSTILLAACGGLAFLLRRRKESARHALWVGALLLLPLLPALSLLVSSMGAPVREIPMLPAYIPEVSAPAPVAANPETIQPVAVPQATSALPSQTGSKAPVRFYAGAAGLTVYAGVALFLISAVLAGRLRVRRWIREGEAVMDDRTLDIFDRVCGSLGLRREVTLIETVGTPVPFAFHTFHPVVALPKGFASRLSDSELASVLAHELAHIQRHDPLTLTLVSLVRAVFFFQPLAWLASREIAYLSECACDSAALEMTGEARSYAGLISRLAEELPRRAASPEYAAGLVLSRSMFLKRVESILSERQKSMKRLTGLALAGTLAAATISLAAALACGPGEGGKKSAAPVPHSIQDISVVSIPGGTFQMGNVENTPKGRPEEKPVHTVTVSSFDMSVCEITNAQYAKYLNQALASGDIAVTAESVKGAKGEYAGKEYLIFTHGPDVNNECWVSFKDGTFTAASGKEKWPVVFVTWYGAKAFALYYGLDLPTEAEWEYACRGGKQYEYGTDNGKIDFKKANYSVKTPHPVDVGSYPKNPFGLCDMSGNVMEWCGDFFGPYSPESVTNPGGPQTGSDRVARGGGWDGYDAGFSCRASFRFPHAFPDLRNSMTGFRVVHRPAAVPGKKTSRESISGTVTFADTGKPAEGVTVQLANEGYLKEGMTGSDGRYSFDGVPSGKYELSFYIKTAENGNALPEYAPQTLRIVYATGRVLRNLDARLPRGGIITGRVTKADTGEPVPGVRIFERNMKAPAGVTDGKGFYRMRAISGPVWLCASGPQPKGYAYETPPVSVTAREGKIVKGADFAYRRITTVSGKVLSPEGKPVEGANVRVTRHAPVYDGTVANMAGTGGVSKSDGIVVLNGMVEGETATLDVENKSAGLRGSLEFTLRTGKEAVLRDAFVIRLQRFALHDLEGRIVNETGAPVEMAKVTFTPNHGETNSGAYSNSIGKFRLAGLETGKNYRITVEARGYQILERKLSPFTSDMAVLKNIVLKKSPI